MTREIDRWHSAPASARRFVYRSVEEAGRFELQVKLDGEPDEAFQASVRGDGHAVARRMAELLREMDESRNLLQIRRTI